MIVVFGATGRVGRHVASTLAASGVPLRCVSRNLDAARAVLPAEAQIAPAELDDYKSLMLALQGAARVLLATPVHPRLAEHQAAIIDAARASGVHRIVKLSGSAWTLRPGKETTIGAAHRRSEAHLRASGVEAAIVRPNAFMQGLLGRAREEALGSGTLSLALGDARVSAIDARDIADVLVHALLAPAVTPGAQEITGPAALSGHELAMIASTVFAREIAYQPIEIADVLERERARGASAFALRHLEEVLRLMAGGGAARVTSTVADLLGRPARGVADFLKG